MEYRKCPECGSDHLVQDEAAGHITCSNCGIVIETIIDRGAEWRTYEPSEERSRSRSGAPLSSMQPDLGLRTQMRGIQRDAKGTSLNPESQSQFRRLSKLDSRTQSSETRNLATALRELRRLKSHIGIPDDAAELASIYYRRALKHDLIRGRSIDGMIAAALYIACRQKEIPQTLRDLAAASNVDLKELGRCVRILIAELKLKPAPRNFAPLVYRLGDQLKISMSAKRQACEIIDRARDKGVTVGKNPMSIAAAAIYIATIRTGERRTQEQIAKAAKTTPVTIRSRFKEIVRALELEDIE